MSDQLVGEASTYTSLNKQKRQTSMVLVGFETTIPAIVRPQTYTLDRTAIGVDQIKSINWFKALGKVEHI